MQTLELSGVWRLRQANSALALDATVPGDVMTTLVRAKEVPDPYYRENEHEVQWVGESDWDYERQFKVSQALLEEEHVLLQCEGLDTFADIEINGVAVATSNNMHRTYEWNIKPLLNVGQNSIRVHFRSVNEYTRECFRERPFRARVGEGHRDAHPAWVRKEACNFGWDWGPILVTSGIWRPIRILGYSRARLADVLIQQAHADKKVELNVICELLRSDRRALDVRVRVSDAAGVVVVQTVQTHGAKAKLAMLIETPSLWWPNGMGDQPLYQLDVELLDDDGRIMESQSKRIGLRTLVLDRHADQWGESFQFVVNGVPFFAKGANWIPVDALLGRRTREDYHRLIKDAADVNMNMLRVWGGGIYEDDCFYEICDELGICVWQDFMFACMSYPLWDEDFLDNVIEEARDNVRRLRHHPCIALWCGNNEMEQQAVRYNPGPMHNSYADYEVLFDKMLPNVVKMLSPGTDYWPCSPHSPHGNREDYNNPECGDAHLWDVWHGKKPFEWYRTCGHRFNSEFGFQSFPEPRTVRGYTENEDRNVTTAVMEHHQRSGIGNTTIMQYMLDWFRLPCSFEMTLWCSQILQGMAIKYACEHWRRSMPRGMGTLYWQLNDVWPVASWASIDYHGRWKALQYMAKHFFAPMLVSGLEDVAQGTVDVHVTSDRLTSASGRVSWLVTTAAGEKLMNGSKNIRTPINGDRRVTTLDLAALLTTYGPRDLIVWLELKVKREPASTNMVTFGRPKHLALQRKPAIEVATVAQRNGVFRVKLKTGHPVLWCWLELSGSDARYSDNFVHLRPGRTVSITVTPAKSLTLKQFEKTLLVRSLVDTFV